MIFAISLKTSNFNNSYDILELIDWLAYKKGSNIPLFVLLIKLNNKIFFVLNLYII